MEFVNRMAELGELNELFDLSSRKAFMVGIFGLRRVGKTALVTRFAKNKDSFYFFVNEGKTSQDLLDEYSSELKKSGLLMPLEKVNTWDDFVNILFERAKNKIIIFDEFQNFLSIEPSVFSIFQKSYDTHENSPVMIVFLGSLIGFFKNIFEDKRKPLYGRLKSKIKLQPLKFVETTQLLEALDYKEMEEFVQFYSVFGGFPKYYVAIDDFKLHGKSIIDVIEKLFLFERAPLKNEVEEILKQEFGKRKSLYYSILYAIASGKTKINEVATAVNMKESSISRHLDDLVHYFEFVRKEATVFDDKKKTLYTINHPLIKFWFRHIYKNYSEYSIGKSENIKASVASDMNTFVGRQFEEISRQFFFILNKDNELPLDVSKIGTWWGHCRKNGKRKELEIDIVCLDENKKEAMFAECKWANIKEKEAFGIINELKEKAQYVDYKRKKEYFCIIAKKLHGKENLRKQGYYAYDLEDFEKAMKRRVK